MYTNSIMDFDPCILCHYSLACFLALTFWTQWYCSFMHMMDQGMPMMAKKKTQRYLCQERATTRKVALPKFIISSFMMMAGKTERRYSHSDRSWLFARLLSSSSSPVCVVSDSPFLDAFFFDLQSRVI